MFSEVLFCSISSASHNREGYMWFGVARCWCPENTNGEMPFYVSLQGRVQIKTVFLFFLSIALLLTHVSSQVNLAERTMVSECSSFACHKKCVECLYKQCVSVFYCLLFDQDF